METRRGGGERRRRLTGSPFIGGCFMGGLSQMASCWFSLKVRLTTSIASLILVHMKHNHCVVQPETEARVISQLSSRSRLTGIILETLTWSQLQYRNIPKARLSFIYHLISEVQTLHVPSPATSLQGTELGYLSSGLGATVPPGIPNIAWYQAFQAHGLGLHPGS